MDTFAIGFLYAATISILTNHLAITCSSGFGNAEDDKSISAPGRGWAGDDWGGPIWGGQGRAGGGYALSRNDPPEPLPGNAACSMPLRLEDQSFSCPGEERNRFYFDASTRRCNMFLGCKPQTPGNNFRHVWACGQVCSVNVMRGMLGKISLGGK